MMTVKFKVSVAYASVATQQVISLMVEPGTTVAQCILQSGICDQYPEIDLTKNTLGIFSQIVTEDCLVVAGDRVEIYRPLLADPKTARRLRAEAAKSS